MKRFSVVIALCYVAVMLSACGGYDPIIDPGNVGVMSVAINCGRAVVGYPVQLTLSVTLDDGRVIGGITTHLDDPQSGDEIEVVWRTSDENIARIDDRALLIPRTIGFVEVSAQLGEMMLSRVVRIEDPGIPWIAPPSPGIGVAPDDEAPPHELPDEQAQPEDLPQLPTPQPPDDPLPSDPPPAVPCQGFGEELFSFVPGAGAGFGANALPDIVLGPPEGAGAGSGGFDVVSLGLGGEIVIDTFPCTVVDGPGVDFIVFENAFYIGGDPTRPFHELAQVGVSSDGVHAVFFPCSSAAYPFTGCAGWHPVYSNTSNGISPFDTLAAGGDQFDLATVGLDHARYIHIVDIGTTGAAPTAGFDLDAVAVVNGETVP